MDIRSRLGLFMVLETEEAWDILDDFTGDFLGGTKNDLVIFIERKHWSYEQQVTFTLLARQTLSFRMKQQPF